MKVIVAGTRTITDYKLVFDAIERCPLRRQIEEIVVGCAKDDFAKGVLNVDVLGGVWATLNGLPVSYFEVSPATWKRLGKSAGPRRNGEMAAYGDALILFWNGLSRGSASMLNKAVERNFKCWVVMCEQDHIGLWRVTGEKMF